MNPKGFSAVLMLNETEITAWGVRERKKKDSVREKGAQMIVPVGVKFGSREF